MGGEITPLAARDTYRTDPRRHRSLLSRIFLSPLFTFYPQFFCIVWYNGRRALQGRYGAALIFVRWSAANEPDGHLETDFLSYDRDATRAEEAVGRLPLAEVKRHLDRLIAGRRTEDA